jgi:hypothetical protein
MIRNTLSLSLRYGIDVKHINSRNGLLCSVFQKTNDETLELSTFAGFDFGLFW